MGQTPAKTFNPPAPFGSTPQTNNVSQVQPMQQISGPGFAAISGYDQTQQQPPSPMPEQFPSPFGAGSMPAQRRNLMVDFNPFKGLLNQ